MKGFAVVLMLVAPGLAFATTAPDQKITKADIAQYRADYKAQYAKTKLTAPEIDGAAGAMAVALVGGGLALLRRSRRKRES